MQKKYFTTQLNLIKQATEQSGGSGIVILGDFKHSNEGFFWGLFRTSLSMLIFLRTKKIFGLKFVD